jgi:protein O-GlcNAc transferase
VKILEYAAQLTDQGQHAEAELICNSVLQDAPNEPGALFVLGNALCGLRRWEDASACFEHMVQFDADDALVWNNLAQARSGGGHHQEAVQALREALRIDPSYASAWHNLGQQLSIIKQPDESRGCFLTAEKYYRQQLETEPASASVWKGLGRALLEQRRYSETIAAVEKSLELLPDQFDCLKDLATAYTNNMEYERAFAPLERLLALGYHDASEVWSRIANLHCYIGQAKEGVACFDRAEALADRYETKRAISSARLFVLHYLQDMTTDQIADAHRAWGKTFAQSPTVHLYQNSPDPERPLRIGYLSPDFRTHAVIFFIQPVLAAHTVDLFEIYCYANVARPDLVTEQIKTAHPVVWRDIHPLSDEDACALIMRDRIDILVDLAGHSASNRLPLLARKPAPVQVSWIGYPDTTGVSAIDYRITDAKADPPGMTEQLHTEQLLRLPDSFLCYRPGGDFPVQTPLPRLINGYTTFGSFSNFTKVTPAILELWAEILKRTPGSNFVIKIRGLSDEAMQRRVTDIFVHNGVAADRIKLLTFADSVVNHLQEYSRIDIALDTFPYCGTTTTCEASFMGVPVVSLAGRSHVSRVGASLLSTIGLGDLVAESAEQYVTLAVRLASDLPRLLSLRKGLRQLLLSSSLCDNMRFVRNLEDMYRQVWRLWCQAHHDSGRCG